MSSNPVPDFPAATAPLVPQTDILVEAGNWPEEAVLLRLVHEALRGASDELGTDFGGCELSLVFTDDPHIRSLNATWRGKDKPTNVLSFPASDLKRDFRALPPMLGDIVLGFQTIATEAASERKPFDDHLRHLLVHGLLHLLGYDHETEADTAQMEELERRILARLAIPDPYA